MSREGSRRVFGWLKSERRERRRKIRLDRKHLEARARRFLKIYLNADETRKPQFYRVVEEASKQCRPMGSGLPLPELEDNPIAEVTSSAAMKIVVARNALKKDDPAADFVTDAYATGGAFCAGNSGKEHVDVRHGFQKCGALSPRSRSTNQKTPIATQGKLTQNLWS
jgi:hypothetical protein